jgi:hypothetical protein
MVGLSKTKNFKIGICSFSAKNATLKITTKFKLYCVPRRLKTK